MDSIDYQLQTAVTNLHLAVPSPGLWSGPAATSCALAIEKLVIELDSLRVRLNTWVI